MFFDKSIEVPQFEDISNLISNKSYPLVYLPESYINGTNRIIAETKACYRSIILKFPSFFPYKEKSLEEEISLHLNKKKPIRPTNYPIEPKRPERTVIPSKNPIVLAYGELSNKELIWTIIIIAFLTFMPLIENKESSAAEYDLVSRLYFMPIPFIFVTFYFYLMMLTKYKRIIKSEKINFENLMKDYEIAFNDYLLKKQDFQSLENKYNLQLEKFKNNIKFEVENFVRDKFKSLIYVIEIPTRSCNKVLKGKTEISFLENYLLPEFGNKIKIDMSVGSFTRPYNPDFVYCEDGLYIDIEIDEPYDLVEKKPIHFIDCGDEERNDYFLKNNWFIVRFCEEQILNSPLECISFLNHIICCVKNHTVKNFDFSKLGRINRWSYEEAYLLSEKNYRK